MEGDLDKKNEQNSLMLCREHMLCIITSCTQEHVQTQEKRQASAEKPTKIQTSIPVARKVTATTMAQKTPGVFALHRIIVC